MPLVVKYSWLVPTLTLFAIFFSGDICDGEKKLGLPNVSCKSDLMTPGSLLGWARPLTYDVISKPTQGHNMSRLSNAANDMQSYSERRKFQKVQGCRHTFLAGGTRISAVPFGSDQWNGMCFYGTDKYVNWLRSV